MNQNHTTITPKSILLKMIGAMLVSVFFLVINQQIIWIFNPGMDAVQAPLWKRSLAGWQPSVFMLYAAALVIWTFLIVIALKPLFNYLSHGTDYDKARISLIRIPWINLALQIILWTIGTLFYFIARHSLVSEAGLHVGWLLSMKISIGMMGALYVSLFTNVILLDVKHTLNITDIRAGENDLFSKNKDLIILVIVLLYTLSQMTYIAFYYWQKTTPDYFPFFGVMVPIVLLFIASGMIVVLFSRRETDYQLRFLKEKVAEFASGSADLSRRVVLINFDQIGEVSFAFNRVMARLEKDFLELKQSALGVRELSAAVAMSAESLAAVSLKNSKSVEAIGLKMEQFLKDLEGIRTEAERQNTIALEASGHSRKVSASIEEAIRMGSGVNQELSESLKRAREGTETVSQSIEKNMKLSSDIQAIAERILSAGRNTGEIDSILGSIDEIADKTNTLAMNAAIEASHAGKAGEGFAVVAQEMRELAENSLSAIGHISEILGKIRTSVTDAQSISETGLATSNETRTLSGRSGKALEKIVGDMEKNSQSVGKISSSLSEQGESLKGFTHEMVGLQESAFSIRETLERQKEAASTIQAMLSEMTASNEESTRAASDLSSLSSEMNKQGTELLEVIGQFKLKE